MQGVGFTRLQRDRFHLVYHRRLVRFWRFVHNLHINRVAQAFSVSHRQAEHQSLVGRRGCNVKGRFRFGAVGDSDRWARNLSPFIGNRITIWIAGSRTIERNGRRARDVLVSR